MIIPSLILMSLVLPDGPVVERFEDLNYPVIYADRLNRTFVEIDGNRYLAGTPLSDISANQDVPQYAGEIEDCRSKEYACKFVSSYRIILPVDGENLKRYRDGLVVDFRRDSDGGITAFATCWASGHLPGSCVERPGMKTPDLSYEYKFDKDAVLRYIKARRWRMDGTPSFNENLILESCQGLSFRGP